MISFKRKINRAGLTPPLADAEIAGLTDYILELRRPTDR
jgi:hypothetical protein